MVQVIAALENRHMTLSTSWVGSWRNQFGSILRITGDTEGRIEGTFETALEDSGFYGQS
jgi:hypothetical protein